MIFENIQTTERDTEFHFFDEYFDVFLIVLGFFPVVSVKSQKLEKICFLTVSLSSLRQKYIQKRRKKKHYILFNAFLVIRKRGRLGAIKRQRTCICTQTNWYIS